ncbi:LysR family transcriptional regulator [Labrenzia sp. R5_0]|nr:LysR family transcriptional regulator [Labrenzia sp. R5_0]
MRQLRYFLAAAEHGTFRKASVALNVQESTISRAIRDLEDELGASLFHRHVGGVSLTVAGQRFLKRSRIIFRQLKDSVREICAIGRGETGRIRIGVLSSLASGFLADLLRAFSDEHTGIEFDFFDGDAVEHVAAIRRLQLDLAFVTGMRVWADCDVELLWSERVFAAIPEGHKLTAKPDIRWHDLQGEHFIVSEEAPGPEIHDYLIRRLADLGHNPDIRRFRVGCHNLLSLVAGGHGVTLTSEATTAFSMPGIVYRPIDNEALSFSAVWSPQNDNPALRRLLSMARRMSFDAAS